MPAWPFSDMINEDAKAFGCDGVAFGGTPGIFVAAALCSRERGPDDFAVYP
jgi:hypothetical protein